MFFLGGRQKKTICVHICNRIYVFYICFGWVEISNDYMHICMLLKPQFIVKYIHIHQRMVICMHSYKVTHTGVYVSSFSQPVFLPLSTHFCIYIYIFFICLYIFIYIHFYVYILYFCFIHFHFYIYMCVCIYTYIYIFT